MERLDKLIASRGTLSRRDAQKKIKNGAVTVNGEICRQTDRKVSPEADRITVDGQAVCTEEHLYTVPHKAAGVVSAKGVRRQNTVQDLLPEELRRPGLFPAGRLDKDTEGLLIITDDGDFAHRMLSPRKHVRKCYLAQLDGELTLDMTEAFARGIVFNDGTKCLPAKLEILPGSGGMSGLVTICEGKFHQVKKMFSAVGRKVVHLKRISIGNLYLDSKLPIGCSRKLTKLEIEAILLCNIDEK